MPLESLTGRESLALDLERSARRLRPLVDRYSADVDAWEAPTREDLARVEAIRALDRVGQDLAPGLYPRTLTGHGAEGEG